MSKYGVGLRNVGSYQVSGTPYLTGSNILTTENVIAAGQEIQIKFPQVTKSVTLWNHCPTTTPKLRLHLVSSSSIANHPHSKHYYELAKDESLTVNMKCREVWLSAIGGDVYWKLYASLTNVAKGNMYALTGSGISS